MKKPTIFIGIDPGFSGGISIINRSSKTEVHGTPTVKSIKSNGKVKTEYNLKEIVDTLKKHKKNSVAFIELVSVRPGEGSVSSFSFGKSTGQLEGMLAALEIPFYRVSPVSWKNEFLNLESEDFLKIKQEIKDKKEVEKTLKDKYAKKLNKKEVSKLQKTLKEQAKNDARLLAAKFEPELSSEFKLRKDDGKAESLLIALYGEKKYNELVSKSSKDKKLPRQKRDKRQNP